MFDEPFAQGHSPLHGLHPGARLVMAAFFAVSVACLRHTGPALVALLLALAALWASAPPWKPLARRLAVVNAFLLFLWLTVPLRLAVGTDISLDLNPHGLHLVWLITLKSNAILAVFLALVSTQDSPTIGHALQRLGTPPKLVFLFLFTYRYIHVIAEEWQRLLTAARMRGFVPRTNVHTWRTLAYLLGMVLVNSVERSDRVYQAMRLRGFQGRFYSLRQCPTRPRDWICAAIWLGTVATLTCTDVFADILPELFHV